MTFKRSFLVLLLFGAVLSSCTYTFYPNTCYQPRLGSLHKVSTLTDTIYETSGLKTTASGFLSINDSGGLPCLYSFGMDGQLTKRIPIPSAQNIDWEAMAEDKNYYYIADVGNNFASRDTFEIYRVPKDTKSLSSWLIEENIISFNYNEEVSQTSSGLNSHDCEAALVFEDSIYIYAKDWVKQETRVYSMPVDPGHYTLNTLSAYPVNALITGADIRQGTHEIVLVGYRNFIPVMLTYTFERTPAQINCGGKARLYLRHAGKQTEGVSFGQNGEIYVTAEKRLHKQALYRAF